MNGESDILFLILTSHGSRDGLAVVAGQESQRSSHPILLRCSAAREYETRS